MNDYQQRLAALSPEQRALFEARLRRSGLSAPKARTIAPIQGRETLAWFPTSLDQERLWFVDQMEPGNPAYNIHSSCRLFGRMDYVLMRSAVNTSIARHEILRTTFQVVDGRPVQVVAPRLEIDLPVIDLSGVPEAEREGAAQAAAVEEASVRFDLEKGPLVRVGLARLAPEDHVLMMVMHHAITDRFSFDIFQNEISRCYVALRDGGEFSLPPLPIQFADFAVWQREEMSGQRLERHLAWWREKLAGAPTILEIPTDRPRPPVMTFTGGRAYIVYPDALLTVLKEITRRAGATMFMTVLAALDVLCWKYTNQRDLIVGSAIADRNRPETEQVIGYFLNMLLLRATIDPAMSFTQLLAQGRETAHGAYAHQDVPFASLVAELRPRQDASRNPLMQVSFIYLDFPDYETPEYAGLSSAGMEVDNGASRFDVTLACTELPGTGIHSYIEYNSDIYDRKKIEGMLRHLGRILELVAANPDRPLRAIDMRTDDERTHAATVASGPARGYEAKLLHEDVEREAARRPDAPAIVQDGTVTTLGDLNDAAEAIARRLVRAGAGPGTFVQVCAERGPAQAAALLATLKTGAAYVPLDPNLPPARLASMLDLARPAVVLVERTLAGSIPQTELPVLEIEDEASTADSLIGHPDPSPRPTAEDRSAAVEALPVLEIADEASTAEWKLSQSKSSPTPRPTGEDRSEGVARGRRRVRTEPGSQEDRLRPAAAASGVVAKVVAKDDPHPASAHASPDDLAYVMFTSGSTGVPKGVMVSHRAIANRLAWAQDRYPLTNADRVLATASFGFDIAAWELFAPLAAGAAVVLPREGEHKDPAALARLLRDERITVAHFVPSLLRPLLDEPTLLECDALRAVFCGGEGMGRELHDRFFDALPGRTLAHFYGPTEGAISCLFHACAPRTAAAEVATAPTGRSSEGRPSSAAPLEAPPGASDDPLGPIPIGLPIANVDVHVLDETLHPVPDDVPGEVYIGGVALARGYLGRADVTAERFGPDPVGRAAGGRLYRTGDVARRRADGALVFLGRADRQIKVRGHRIEPAEIESALERAPGVTGAVVVPRGDGEDRRLVAYLQCPGDPPGEAELRAHLRRSLPEPMVPSSFVVVTAFPLGPTGKIDRAALPDPGRPASLMGAVAPRTPTERVIASVWEALLRREGVGAEDDFFELGGDSLLATQVVSRLRATFDVELPLRRFFEGPTVAALAEKIEEKLVEALEAMPEEEAERRLASDAVPRGDAR